MTSTFRINRPAFSRNVLTRNSVRSEPSRGAASTTPTRNGLSRWKRNLSLPNFFVRPSDICSTVSGFGAALSSRLLIFPWGTSTIEPSGFNRPCIISPRRFPEPYNDASRVTVLPDSSTYVKISACRLALQNGRDMAITNRLIICLTTSSFIGHLMLSNTIST